MHISLTLWLVVGGVVTASLWLATSAPRLKRIRTPVRIAAIVLIFTPTIYLGHPAMIQPVWITIFWDKANIPVAVAYWIVAALAVSAVYWLIAKQSRKTEGSG